MTALVFSRDPGGANQMIGVCDALAGPPVADHPGIATLRARLGGGTPRLHVFAKDFAVALWAADRRPAETWPASPDIAGLLHGREAVLTATADVDDETDKDLWQAARSQGIASHAFVDGDFNVIRRFRRRDGALVWPDFVYVPGPTCARSLLEGGFAPERLTIIPDFALAVQSRRAVDAETGARRLRAQWLGGDGDRRVVLFASENVRELVALGKPQVYSEFDCLEILVDALAGRRLVAGVPSDPEALVVVRPHPKEAPDKFASYERAGRVRVSTAGQPAEAILAADLVVGMRSTLLREAEAIGRPAVSLVGAKMSQTD